MVVTVSVTVVDTSFLCHALLPSQLTPAALKELTRLSASEDDLQAPALVFSEFPSVLRKLENKGQLAKQDAERLFDIFRRLKLTAVNSSDRLLQRSWSLARELGQSDTFDSMGYAVAEAAKAPFLLSDKKFKNAAANRKLPNVQYFP